MTLLAAETFTLATEEHNHQNSTNQVSPVNIIDQLYTCPQWFLNKELSQMSITVRMSNVFKRHQIITVKDVQRKGWGGLMDLPGLGMGSIQRLGILLHQALRKGETPAKPSHPPQTATSLPKPKRKATTNPLPPTAPYSVFNQSVAPTSKYYNFSTLTDNLDEVLDTCNAAERKVIAGRMGWHAQRQTLHEIAEAMHLTRERVRQIEQAAFKKLKGHRLWEILENRLHAILAKQNQPLYLSALPTLDAWFEGLQEQAEFLSEVFKHLYADKFFILSIDHQPIITRLSPQAWTDAIAAGKQTLRNAVGNRPTEKSVQQQVQAGLPQHGQELKTVLWQQVSAHGLWINPTGHEKQLFGYGRTAEDVITAVLEDAGTPLHYSEIEQRASQIQGKPFDQRRLYHATTAVAVLYARGTYGLLAHCPLTEAEMDRVVAEIEAMVCAADPERQWHTSEYLDQLLAQGWDFNGRLTKYTINMALRRSVLLHDMKRMVWCLKEESNQVLQTRHKLHDAVVDILKKAGVPMKTEDIRKALSAQRGVNHHFQIHASGDLVKVGHGMWGLSATTSLGG